jgi:hypothetical protein
MHQARHVLEADVPGQQFFMIEDADTAMALFSVAFAWATWVKDEPGTLEEWLMAFGVGLSPEYLGALVAAFVAYFLVRNDDWSHYVGR